MSYNYWNKYHGDSDSDLSDLDLYSYRKKKPFKQVQSTVAASANRRYPYLAEYAKSNDKCRGCWQSISRGTLRLGVNVQSLKEDNKIQYWYDFQCFFLKQRPKNTVDIHNFENLKIQDQNKIKNRVGVACVNILPDISNNKNNRKRGGNNAASKLKQRALKDFVVEYAKSGRALCRGCLQKIIKGEVRISKKSYDTEIGKKFDGQDMWHHVTCFVALREDLGYFESGDKLPGFNSLQKKDKDYILNEIAAVSAGCTDIKKLKTEPDIPEVPTLKVDENQYKAQNKLMYAYKDQLGKLTIRDLKSLLTVNNQSIPQDKMVMIDRLADAMTFGALVPCNKCNGQLIFENGGYVCTGYLSEWAKCDAIEKEPARNPFQVPPNLAKKKLSDYKYEPRTRIIITDIPITNTKVINFYEPRVQKETPPLYDMLFVILGKPPKGKDEIKKQIIAMGGKVVTKIDEKVAAIISTPEEVEKLNMRMLQAENREIQVVPDDFLDEAKNNVGKIADLIIEKSICDWGSDPSARLPSDKKSTYRSIYTKTVPDKVKIKLKGGVAVDPDSKLDNCAHVYQENDVKYTVVLGLTDIQQGKNSYHKMQLLEADGLNQYWVFQSWGRIGTNIGDNETQCMYTLENAKHFFTSQYQQKTGNNWNNRHNFKKMPNKMYPIDVDYAEEDLHKFEIVESPSTLPTPVQNLVKMIFDIQAMQKLMLEFELDTQKMPLGKLSKAQIQKAFGVLNELQNLITANGGRANFIDASNRFFTFIPHSFGLSTPPVLNDENMIKQKLEMLNSLMELEIAFNLIQTSNKSVDNCYDTLNTEIGVLDRNSEEYKIILEYVRNTHANTHSGYQLVVEEVFTVKRQGEDERFQKFREMKNHKLLWHGSRVTNYAGILSQGLRIAPVEAPVTGSMFGKGIYFADMVSKSANYCFANHSSPKGLMLLCDVALGNMYDRLYAEDIKKLPKGMDSCRGLGKTHPDPRFVKKIDNIEVPVGRGVHQSTPANSHLLYNEYIVYDVSQVNLKYLVKMHFNFKPNRW